MTVTTITIFLTTILWTCAISLGWAQPRGKLLRVTWVWAMSLILFIAHIVAAFQAHYHWSHDIAFAETARQTKEVFGLEVGYGIYVNYAFTICLVIDLVLQFASGLHYRGRKFIDGFVIFMIINGAIVFGSLNSRIFGTLCLVILFGAFIKYRKHEST